MKVPTFVALYESSCPGCGETRYMVKQSRDIDDLPAAFGEVRLVAHVKGNWRTARSIASAFLAQPGVAFAAPLPDILRVMRAADSSIEIVQRMQAEDDPAPVQQQDAKVSQYADVVMQLRNEGGDWRTIMNTYEQYQPGVKQEVEQRISKQ